MRIARPQTLNEAIGLLEHEPGAKPLGGGTAIQILRRQGLIDPPLLVDLAPLPELRGIHRQPDALHIGAMVTHREVERSPLVQSTARLLCDTYRKVGNVRVRHTATVGGNLAHGDYRLDPPAALLVCGASVTLAGPAGSRVVPLQNFFVDLLETALQPAELIVSISIPIVAGTRRSSAFEKFSSLAANDWPCVSVAAALEWDDGDVLHTARLGITAMATTPLLVDVPVASGMTETDVADVAETAVLTQVDPLPDLRGSADYKRRACTAAVRDAIAVAWRAQREAVPA